MNRRRPISWLAALLLVLGAAASAESPAGHVTQLEIDVGRSFLLRPRARVTRVSVGDPEVVFANLLTPRQVLLSPGARPGTTNLILWYGDDQAEVFDVRVQPSEDAAARVREGLAQSLPEARLAVRAEGPGLVLDGEVESIEVLERALAIARSHSDELVNLVRVRGTQQVQLAVRIAEVSRSGLREMGMGAVREGLTAGGVIPAGQASASLDGSSGSGVGAAASLLSTLIELEAPFASAFQVFGRGEEIFAVLSLLRGQGLARILASPTLVTMSGQEASFLVGGEFPVPIAVRDGVVAIEFKEFGTLLRFTPTVLGPETIHLQIEPEVSSLDFSTAVASAGTAVPGLRTRRGTATLQLRDAETFVMAGLLQEESGVVDDRVPFLGDIPLLGGLFTRKQARKQETEILVAVTPRLVRPLAPDAVPALPGEQLDEGRSDLDFFLLNDSGVEAHEPANPPADPAAVSDPARVAP